MHLGFAALGVWLSRFQGVHEAWFTLEFIQGFGMFLIPFGLVFSVVNFAAPKLPRNVGTWVLHLSNIMLGVVYCWPLPWSIWLIFRWYRPEVKAAFGVPS